MNDASNMKTLAETENYLAWETVEPDGETSYHLELGSMTLHFFPEEWEELLSLADEVLASRGGSKRR